MLWNWGNLLLPEGTSGDTPLGQFPTCMNERSVLRRQGSRQTNECVLLLRLKLEKRARYVEQHSRGPRIDKRIERGALVIAVEEVTNRDTQPLCNGKKLGGRDLIDSLLDPRKRSISELCALPIARHSFMFRLKTVSVQIRREGQASRPCIYARVPDRSALRWRSSQA
jgi:hypothetical protein